MVPQLNLGLEFGMGINGPNHAASIPGKLKVFNGNDQPGDFYAPRTTSLTTLVKNGANVLRLAFTWERLVPNMPKSLNGGGVVLNATYAAYIGKAIATATGAGGQVILDLHNYGRYYFRGTSGLNSNVLGDGTLQAEHLAQTWKAIARKWGTNPRVMFGIMNEPHDLPDAGRTYVSGVIASIREIRQISTRRIFVCGTDWSSLKRWVDTSAWVVKPIIDQKFANIVWDMHHYLDYDYSGQHDDCSITDHAASFARTTQWLLANNQKGFLGEIGTSPGACATVMRNALNYLHARPNQWIGFAYFSSGSAWGGARPNYYIERADGYIGGDQYNVVKSFQPKVL